MTSLDYPAISWLPQGKTNKPLNTSLTYEHITCSMQLIILLMNNGSSSRDVHSFRVVFWTPSGNLGPLTVRCTFEFIRYSIFVFHIPKLIFGAHTFLKSPVFLLTSQLFGLPRYHSANPNLEPSVYLHTPWKNTKVSGDK